MTRKTSPLQPHAVPAPSAPSASTLLDLFREAVAASPDRLAIDADDGQLTHAELFDAARALAGRLRRIGIGPGDRVGVHLPSGSVDLYVAILGVLHAGAAYVPVDAGDPDTTASTADATWAQVDVVAVVEPDLEVTERRTPSGARRAVAADDEALVMLSGTAVAHRAVVALVEAGARDGDLSPRDRVLASLSDGIGGSGVEMWLAWRSGAVLIPAPRALARGGHELREWMAARRVNVVLPAGS